MMVRATVIMPMVPYGPYEMDYSDEEATGFSPPNLNKGHFCGTDKTKRCVGTITL